VEGDFEFSASWYGFRMQEGVSSEMQEKGCSPVTKFFLKLLVSYIYRARIASHLEGIVLGLSSPEPRA